jgi:hypothetical protein
VSPLLTVQLVPAAIQLIIKFPDVVLGVKLRFTDTVVFIIPAVYTFVVYRVFSSTALVSPKEIFSGSASRTAQTSAIYFVVS